MKVDSFFVTSAARAADLPGDGLAELAMVGRSNVGKSSLINALVRQRVARTSGAPGKTRLANIYRVARGRSAAFYLVDLPGYGYARGDQNELEEVTRAYFRRADGVGQRPSEPRSQPEKSAAVLLVDSRHPGLAIDIDAWRWLQSTVDRAAIVATKIDKLSRAERLHAITRYEAVLEHPVLPVSAATGEGLDELWTLIERLLNSSNPPPRNSQVPSRMAPEASRQRRRPKN